MPQNERNELATLAEGVAGLLRRRRGLGLRRTPAIPAPGPPPRAARPAQAPIEAPRPGHAATTSHSPEPAATPAPAAQPTESPPRSAPAASTSTAASESTALDLSGYRSLEELAAAANDCSACGLSKSRRNVFMGFGEGSSGVLFIDETPGTAADAGGSPFQGASGELLGNIVTKGMGLPLEAIQLISLVKCQPSEGAPPEPSELSTCRAWLERQMEWLDPKVIVTLGRPASAAVLGLDAPLGRLRGELHSAFGRPVVATYHPEYLVRSPQYKKQAWEDIQLAMTTAGIPLPARK